MVAGIRAIGRSVKEEGISRYGFHYLTVVLA
jgi:hypothetical protein